MSRWLRTAYDPKQTFRIRRSSLSQHSWGDSMKVTLAATVLMAAIMGGSAAAQPAQDSPTGNAEACIRAGAPAVAQANHGLTDAVDFLVDDLCGVEVQRALSYATSERTLDSWKTQVASAQLAGVSIDADTGELKTPPGFSPPFNVSNAMLDVFKGLEHRSATFKATAAKAILAARASATAH